MNLPISRTDERFVRDYVTTGDAVFAAQTSGIRLPGLSMREGALVTLQRPDIQEAIRKAKLEMKYSQPLELTQRSVAEDFEHIFDMAILPQGEGRGPDLKAAIMAKEAQAKVLGLMINKVEVSRAKDVGEATTEELQRWLRDHQKMIEGDSKRVIDAEEVASEDMGVRSVQEDR